MLLGALVAGACLRVHHSVVPDCPEPGPDDIPPCTEAGVDEDAGLDGDCSLDGGLEDGPDGETPDGANCTTTDGGAPDGPMG